MKQSFKINDKIRRIAAERGKLRLVLGKMAVNHFKLGFRKGGWQTDASSGGWEPRKRATKSDKRTGKSRPILVGRTKRLGSSIRILSSAANRIVVGTTGIKYAAIHNEGLKGKAFGKYDFKMPKREFIGESMDLRNKIQKRIEKSIGKILKGK